MYTIHNRGLRTFHFMCFVKMISVGLICKNVLNKSQMKVINIIERSQ